MVMVNVWPSLDSSYVRLNVLGSPAICAIQNDGVALNRTGELGRNSFKRSAQPVCHYRRKSAPSGARHARR